ncbi:MAG: barstar family protein [Actinobacteria bacterium]|nr:barstar family protein [Actinomycetota bacterium]MCB8996336.1 barstar family protein [Actinomycetota bacterium]MCB9414856.1 barstar family protein [Actinomycetota bacterium]HRY09754.1 barstar family protein [Candidatus Nanopelagicales bacterium]
MSLPQVVALDTRGAHDKAAFLAACAQSLDFPDYFGHNWDALSDSLGDFARQHAPVLVVWTGFSDLEPDVRTTALDIMTERFVDGADLLIVDDVVAPPQPDFALDHVQVAIPAGGEDTARAFWVGLVGLAETPKPLALARRGGLWLTGDALNLHLGIQPDFQPATQAHPAIMVKDYDALVERLRAAGHDVTPAGDQPDTRRFHTHDPFGNRLEFIAF